MTSMHHPARRRTSVRGVRCRGTSLGPRYGSCAARFGCGGRSALETNAVRGRSPRLSTCTSWAAAWIAPMASPTATVVVPSTSCRKATARHRRRRVPTVGAPSTTASRPTSSSRPMALPCSSDLKTRGCGSSCTASHHRPRSLQPWPTDGLPHTSNGLSRRAPVRATSFTLRVTSVRSWTIAVAASRPSTVEMGSGTLSRPQSSATRASTGNRRDA